MKVFLLIVIKLYWYLIPKNRRRKCLFKKSCSNYVYETTKSEGLFSGLKALKFRVKNCNPHYSIMELDGEKVLITKSNKIFKENFINQSIITSF
ncbi:hypothetical protein BTO05_00495 [Winogradskyella sp. PC-19]|uniref:membrane protein insertion efficiency factor YidD n=1 Tax=Winogradskyella sp. PC-19 TaxID=754417 RepID=UPI000B3CF328|nr:hypothetical protein BTO05_00495 [Winogradskyella sp. PC-19]